MSVHLSLSVSWLREKWFDRNKILKYVAIYQALPFCKFAIGYKKFNIPEEKCV